MQIARKEVTSNQKFRRNANTNMSRPIIKVENLSKQYQLGVRQEAYSTFRESLTGAMKAPLQRLRRNGTASEDETLWALKDVNFEVQPGEVVGIIGRNGAGKSTLLKVLSRITEPTTGTIKLYGRIASLLEVGTGFHPELTGRENIFLNGSILGMGKREIERQFDEIVNFAEVEKFLDTPVKRYSSGMYVRLAFSVAAHLEPEVLVVDEVLSVGDIKFQQKCLGKMDDVAKGGRTVLFVSHNLSAMQQLCQKGIYLRAGEVRQISDINLAVDAYQRDLQDSDVASKLCEADVKEGDARYINWKIENSSLKTPHSCLSGDICDFQLTLVCKKKIRGAVFGFTLQDLSGQKLLSFHSKDVENERLDLDTGTHKVRWSAKVTLRAGQYQIIAGFGEEENSKLFDMWSGQPLLNVLSDRNTVLPESWLGLINEDFEFEVENKRN